MFKVRDNNWIQTYTGGLFWPLDPQPEEVSIADIAHALSMLCRFNGHCKRFHSVAEHSVLLTEHIVLAHPSVSSEIALWALLHDAPEIYLTDLVAPIKPFITGYVEAERRVMDAVCTHFELPMEMPELVYRLDKAMATTEALQNMAEAKKPWTDGREVLAINLRYWTPEEAEREFLLMFHTLWEARKLERCQDV